MEITGGKLAEAFGTQAYLRIVPQAGSTFNGEFTADFSGERPLTNLRSARGKLPATVPEPTTLDHTSSPAAPARWLPVALAGSGGHHGVARNPRTP